MSDIKVVVIFAILTVFSFAATSCSKNTENIATNSNNTIQPPKSSPANDNIDELGMLVKLPFVVVETAFLETPANADNAQKLVAVVRFTSADAEKLVAELTKSGEPVTASLVPDEWFPTELITKNEMTGDGGLTGRSYSAEMVIQPPYTSGRVIHIDETDFFVIELSTK